MRQLSIDPQKSNAIRPTNGRPVDRRVGFVLRCIIYLSPNRSALPTAVYAATKPTDRAKLGELFEKQRPLPVSALIIGLLILFMANMANDVSGANVQAGTESNVEKRDVRGQTVQSERDEQEALFNYYFRERKLKYETRLKELKASASVPKWRIPYSADIHPQAAGGLGDIGSRGRRSRGGSSSLSVYDRAFNDGRDLANSYEVQRVLGSASALFVGRRLRRNNEGWEGYCSGFTASTIMHPEPVKPVDAGQVGGSAGVVFQPSDIKALLSCIYNRTTDDSYLYVAPPSAKDGGPNMGTFHLALVNYIGQAGHPVGIDRTKGQAAWNNPIYAYEVTSIRDAGDADHVHHKTVETTVTYSFYGSDSGSQTDQETGDVRGNTKQTMSFRYTLAINDDGKIVGGTALSYSGYFLWIPLYAVQGRQDGSAPGKPPCRREEGDRSGKSIGAARGAEEIRRGYHRPMTLPCSPHEQKTVEGRRTWLQPSTAPMSPQHREKASVFD